MNSLRVEVDRVETIALRVAKRLEEAESRLAALEQAVIEISADLRRLGEEMSPKEEMEPSEDL